MYCYEYTVKLWYSAIQQHSFNKSWNIFPNIYSESFKTHAMNKLWVEI